MQNPAGNNLPWGSDSVFVIAEIGKNFIETQEERPISEYLENAKRLVKAAKDAGADAVKFQTHEVEDEQLPLAIVSPHFKAADRYNWVSRNTKVTPLEEFWIPLKQFCDECGITFFSTPMSRKAAMKLAPLNVPFWKVGSGDVQDYVLLDYLALTGKPVIISSGMVSHAELIEVVAYLTERKVPTVILYCISQYPAPKDYFNLSTIERFREEYPHATIGFSDHSLGDDVALAAVKAGARIVEKHFSFSRELWGADHKVSMTPAEFKAMVDGIRSGAFASADPSMYWGTKDKELEGAHNEFRAYFNKTLVAGRDLESGEVLTAADVYAMRPQPAGVLPANRFHDIVDKRMVRPLKKFEPLSFGALA